MQQPTTPTRPVSGTFYEAVQLLCPHPKIRPISAPAPDAHSRHHTATPDADQWSVPSGSTIVDRSDSPHIYTSRRQYEVATSRALGLLGRLDTDVPPHTPGSISPVPRPLSAKSIIGRAKELFSPRSSSVPKTPEGEKVHGAFCRTKSVVKNSLRRSSKGGVAEARSWDSLLSGFCSKESHDLETSTISDEPPQIAPLRPVSKFLPDLTINIPDNEIGSSIVIEHNSIKDEEEADNEDSCRDSLHVAPLRLRSSNVTSVPKYGDTTAETSFYTAGETSFYYTPAAKEDDDDVFTTSVGTSQTERPMTSFMAKLQDAMEPNRGYKTPSIASTTGSTGSPIHTPSPSSKLRHTTLQPRQGLQTGSLRTQYSKAEPDPPVLSVPKMWQLNHKESTRNLRVAPSLEKGLHADTLEVFEENAMAKAAAIVHVEPDVVEVLRSQVVETSEQQSRMVPNHEQFGPDMEVAPLNVVPKVEPARRSNIGPDHDVSTMPIEILHTIVFSAAYGDAKCTGLASALYQELTEAGGSVVESKWDGRKQRLLLQSHLLEELKILMQYGFMQDDVFAVIRSQIFPTGTTEMLSNEDFTNYIRRAVSDYKLAEERAEEILGLAIGEEDEEFAQTSPEEEVFFQREPFNSQGFVYDASSSDEYYERLGSLPSTVGTFEESEPEPQRSSGWRVILFVEGRSSVPLRSLEAGLVEQRWYLLLSTHS